MAFEQLSARRCPQLSCSTVRRKSMEDTAGGISEKLAIPEVK